MSSSANPEEVAKFNSIADQWWDLNGPTKPLHAMNIARMAYITTHCPPTGLRWLDVGCGAGILSESLAASGADVTALDASDKLIACAKEHAQDSGLNINYRLELIENHAPGELYDAISCLELLEHVDDPASLLRECARLLKPGGKLFVSTLNRNPASFLFGIVAAEYVMGLVPRGTHRYQQFIKPSELADWMSQVDIGLQGISGINYNPLANTASLTESTRINYILHGSLSDQT